MAGAKKPAGKMPSKGMPKGPHMMPSGDMMMSAPGAPGPASKKAKKRGSK